jgi:hypothetical protein
LLLRGLLEVGAGGAVGFYDSFRKLVEDGLALGGGLIGGEEVVETAVFSDDDY